MKLWRSKPTAPGPSRGPSTGLRETASYGNLTFRVPVPDHIKPGEEFSVWAANRIVRIRCPPDMKPGQAVQITVDESSFEFTETRNDDSIMLPADRDGSSSDFSNVRFGDSPNVQRVENGGNGPPTYTVTIPDGILGGQLFPVTIQGQELMVTSPTKATPGTKVRIFPPLPNPQDIAEEEDDEHDEEPKVPTPPRPKDDDTRLFEVLVPHGVKPGSPFALLAGGVRVLVTCPGNAGPGKRIRFRLHLAVTQKHEPQSETAAIKLSYDKDGWARTIRVSDMKFQWVRMDDNGDVDTNTRFNAEKSAYVRKIEFRTGNDVRVRDGILSLVPADKAFCDSCIKGPAGQDFVTYAEVAEAQVKTFEDKVAWFKNKCVMMGIEWIDGHMSMNVRRTHLVEDSIKALKSLTRKDFRKIWRFNFIGEAGIDAGGLKRDWFQGVTSNLFDPNFGLWQSLESNQMCMMINPASKHFCDDYLEYYRFLGRVMGKALYDGELVAGHMAQCLYKHILGWPITFKDIEHLDEEYYTGLKKLKDLSEAGEDLSMMCVNFTTTHEIMGAKEEVELIKGGADIDVTNDNFPEYLEACLKYRMLGMVKPQLNELMLGFFDVIPEPLLTIFDFQELELLMCGLPNIDMDDWKDHTEYSGDYDQTGADDPTCQWFWEVVEEFDQEMRARLLQFVTGTSGVPAGGFGVLQGNDGNVRLFTIQGVSVSVCLYPRAHTCFNRIDLPTYETKDDLRERLKLAVTMVSTGFDLE